MPEYIDLFIRSTGADVRNGEIWTGNTNGRLLEASHVLLPDVMPEAQACQRRNVGIEALWIGCQGRHAAVGVVHCVASLDRYTIEVESSGCVMPAMITTSHSLSIHYHPA